MPKVKHEWIVNRKEKETIISESEINLQIENLKEFLSQKQEVLSNEFPLVNLQKVSWSVKIRDHKEKADRMSFTVMIRGFTPPQHKLYKWSHTALVNGLQIYSYSSENVNQDRETYSWANSLALKNAKNDTLALTLKLQVKLCPNQRRNFDYGSQNSIEMLNMLKQLSTENKDFADFIFIVEGKELKVHKNILAACSPVLATMFKTKMVESASSCCEVKDVDFHMFSAIVQFAYTRDLPYNFALIAQKLYEIADYYQVTDLKLRCEEEIRAQLKPENAVDIYNWAGLYEDLKALKASAWDITKTVVLKDNIADSLLGEDELKPEVVAKIKDIRVKELDFIKDLKKQ